MKYKQTTFNYLIYVYTRVYACIHTRDNEIRYMNIDPDI